MIDVALPSLPTYAAPPVKHRIFTLMAEITSDVYYARADELKEAMMAHFSIYEPQQEWLLNIEHKNGVPQVHAIKPVVLIKHTFWHTSPDGQKLVGCTVEPEKISIILRNLPNHTERFPTLKIWTEKIVPIWAKLLNPKISAAILDYANTLSRETVPTFINPNGSLAISEILTVFAGFPGKHQGIVPPYDCTMGLAIDQEQHVFLNLRVHGLPQIISNGSAVQVDLQALKSPGKHGLTATEAIDSLDLLHKTVVDKFEIVFTPKAKATFQPK
jgi:hypothetical protein